MKLKNTHLTIQQIVAICMAMTTNSPLKILKLAKNEVNSVDDKLLAQAVNQLEEVDLYDTKLTTQQAEEILVAIITSSKLKVLNMQNNKLSSVDPDIMAKAVNKLDSVEMYNTDLTQQQITKILSRSLVKTSLDHIAMGNGQGQGFNMELFKQAMKFIRQLYLV